MKKLLLIMLLTFTTFANADEGKYTMVNEVNEGGGVWILNNELDIIKYCWEILNTLQTPVHRVECSDWRELQNHDERMEY